MDVYEPSEDSFLLQSFVTKYATGNVLEMGTGSGILSKKAAQKKSVKSVLAVDINPAAIARAKKEISSSKVAFLHSDLFSKVPSRKYSTIIFNPPYLPDDGMPHDPALIGGKKGYETTVRFLHEATRYLERSGSILLLISSHTQPSVVKECLDRNLLSVAAESTTKIDFETLFAWKIEKTSIAKELEKKGVKDIEFAAEGKRGLVFKGVWKKKSVAIKIQHPDSQALGRIDNEITMMKRLKGQDYVPAFLFSGDNYFVREWAEGIRILDYITKANKTAIKKMLLRLLDICYSLDSLNISKEEMHHPWKHVLVGKKVMLIDFERAHLGVTHRNVTQFLQMVRSLEDLFRTKNIKVESGRIRELAKSYSMTAANQEIIAYVSSL